LLLKVKHNFLEITFARASQCGDETAALLVLYCLPKNVMLLLPIDPNSFEKQKGGIYQKQLIYFTRNTLLKRPK
jgi:hypothetical protein